MEGVASSHGRANGIRAGAGDALGLGVDEGAGEGVFCAKTLAASKINVATNPLIIVLLIEFLPVKDAKQVARRRLKKMRSKFES